MARINEIEVLTDAVIVDRTGRQVLLLPGTQIQKVDGCETVYEVKNGQNQGLRFEFVQSTEKVREKEWI